MKIKDLFKRKSKKVEAKIIEPVNGIIPENGVQCHYCGKLFEIQPSKAFPTNVRSCDGNYFFQGKGYLCPHCLKTCIIG